MKCSFRAFRLAFLIALFLSAIPASAPAGDLAIVHVGYATGSMSSLVVRIADSLGYFRAERLKVDLLPFDSGANEVGPLEGVDIDVAAGEASAKLYAAVAGGSAVRIVAPAVSDPPGRGAQPLVVRADLVKSGRFKDVADLKGLTIAVGAPGTSSWSMLNELLRRTHLQTGDVKPLALPFKDHRLALTSSVVDASLLPEPDASQAVEDGVAVRVVGNDVFYPNQDTSVAIFSGTFIGRRRDVAMKFMYAYVQAARTYNAAVVDGKLAGPNAGRITQIVADAMPGVDPAVAGTATPFGIDPDARLNAASLQKDLSFFQAQGLVGAHVHASDAVDETFAATAVALLGAYHSPQSDTANGSGGSANWIVLGLVGTGVLLLLAKVGVEILRT